MWETLSECGASGGESLCTLDLLLNNVFGYEYSTQFGGSRVLESFGRKYGLYWTWHKSSNVSFAACAYPGWHWLLGRQVIGYTLEELSSATAYNSEQLHMHGLLLDFQACQSELLVDCSTTKFGVRINGRFTQHPIAGRIIILQYVGDDIYAKTTSVRCRKVHLVIIKRKRR